MRNWVSMPRWNPLSGDPGDPEKALGADHPDYAQTLINLALFYEHTAIWTRPKRSTCKPFPSLRTAMARNIRAMLQPGRISPISIWPGSNSIRAEAYYLEARSIREATVGKMHPSMPPTQVNLAILYLGSAQGKSPGSPDHPGLQSASLIRNTPWDIVLSGRGGRSDGVICRRRSIACAGATGSGKRLTAGQHPEALLPAAPGLGARTAGTTIGYRTRIWEHCWTRSRHACRRRPSCRNRNWPDMSGPSARSATRWRIVSRSAMPGWRRPAVCLRCSTTTSCSTRAFCCLRRSG